MDSSRGLTFVKNLSFMKGVEGMLLKREWGKGNEVFDVYIGVEMSHLSLLMQVRCLN